MNKGIKETRNFMGGFLKEYKEKQNVDVFIAPPFTSLPEAQKYLAGTGVETGAQNMFWEDEGAYTGEISPEFLREMGIKWVILGHSERRKYFGEVDEDIKRKIETALHYELKVVLCIGETEEEREKGMEKQVVEKQLKGAINGVDIDCNSFAIAYEPVWAIGTGKTAKPEDAENMHVKIRDMLGEKGKDIRIIYGGSVKPHNAEELMGKENIDGALIGGASLNPESFIEIINIAGGLV